jgi:cysteinyl-tRNA synthetase
MSKKTLGLPFDIHGGGRDLIFPHHENEIAQSCCSTANIDEPSSYAKYWMHNGFVTINGEKMAKSLGNIILVKDLAENYHGEVIRLALLSSHYRQGLDWNEKVIHQANKLINKLYEIKDDLDEVVISKNNKNNLDTISILMDDLNTPGLITELNKIVKEYNSLEVDRENIKTRLSLISKVLGILQDETFNNISEEFKSKIDYLVAKRSNAKKNKNFELADAIREELLELGIEIKDSSDGTKWTLKS